jgi:hypothetical protein
MMFVDKQRQILLNASAVIEAALFFTTVAHDKGKPAAR